jgi:putative heme-binding domain-containing protein
VASHDAGNEWTRLAILSGLGDSAWPFLQRLFQADRAWRVDPKPEREQLLARIGAIIGASGRDDEVRALVRSVAGSDDRGPGAPWALMSGLVDGLARRGLSLDEQLRDKESAPAKVSNDRGALELASIGAHAKKTALDGKAAPARRVAALNVFVRLDPEKAAATLQGFLEPQQPLALQSAAARALATIGRTGPATEILNHWNDFTTTTRRELLSVFSSNRTLAEPLVRALEDGTVSPAELDLSTRDSLGRVTDPALRKRIAPLLAKAAAPDRAEALKKYQQALSLQGDAARGQALFAKNCQTCHQKRGQGQRVGPDLSGVAGRPANALLNDILDPSREVAPDYVAFQLVTKQGQMVTGLLAEETAGALKLRRNEGAEETVLRSEIEEFRSTGRSLMPEGLEQTLSVQDVADVIEYLRRP